MIIGLPIPLTKVELESRGQRKFAAGGCRRHPVMAKGGQVLP
jgi:hypothetical protein